MKLLCISAAADEAKEEQGNLGDHQTEHPPTKLRSWYNSFRKGLKRKGKEPRVTISEPIKMHTLTQSELIQINGVIEVKPEVTNGEDVIKTGDAVETPTTDDKEDGDDRVDGSNIKSAPSNTELNSDHEGEEEDEDEEEETSEQLVGYSWFWGGISRREAEALLRGRKDGTFLVRDSSDRPRYLYSLSFRSNGKTMHTRIEQNGGRLFFSSTNSPTPKDGIKRNDDGSRSLGALISVAMNQNNGADSIFFYSRGLTRNGENGDASSPVPSTSLHTVHLNTPLSRFAYLLDFQYNGDGGDQKKALQYLCKFVLHHVPEARAKIESDEEGGQLETLPVELQQFATSSEYFPRQMAAVK